MIEKISKPGFKISDDTLDQINGKLTVTPLVKGMGVTLGNSLRRIMLESMPGAAVHAVKIEGAAHEFATITGVKEDAAQIILNLKELSIKITDAAPEDISIKIKTEDAGEITAASFIAPAGVEIINKDLYIATLAEGHSLEMEAKVSIKTGYRTWNDNKDLEKATGFIATDSNYCPVKKVNYIVEPAKSRDEIGTEELTIEVETDGSATAKEAISWAANILNSHLELFVNLDESIKETEIISENLSKKDDEVQDFSIEHLELSVRPYNCLKNAGITTLSELISKTKKEIKAIKNLGNTSCDEVISKLKEMGYELK